MEKNKLDIFAKENKQVTMEFYYEGTLRQMCDIDLNTQKGANEYRSLYSHFAGRGAKVANLYKVEAGIKTLIKKTEFPVKG